MAMSEPRGGGNIVDVPPVSRAKLGASHSLVIDGLRAVAVLLVIILHFKGIFLGGKGLIAAVTTPGIGGVYLFFVLSGLCISLSKTERTSWGSFFIRRVFRLIPACWVCLLIVFLGQYSILHSLPTADELIGSFGMMPNYFQSALSVDPVLWSLQTEIGLYLLFPLSLYVYKKLSKRNFVLVSVAASVVAYIIWLNVQHRFSYFPPFVSLASWIIWNLGLIISFDRSYLSMPKPAINRTLVYAIILLALGSAVVLLRNVLRNNDLAFWYFLDGLGFYYFTIWSLAVTPSWLRSKPIVWIGTRSYSLYLYHYPVARFVKEVFPNPLIGLLVSITIVVALSEISFKLVEQPFILIGKNLSARFGKQT